MLIQTDWDFPSVAGSFGWSTRHVQKCDRCGHASAGHSNIAVKYCRDCNANVGNTCYHSGTDGTVKCSECGLQASDFILAARNWIDDNDGAEAEDPGYFEPVAA